MYSVWGGNNETRGMETEIEREGERRGRDHTVMTEGTGGWGD